MPSDLDHPPAIYIFKGLLLSPSLSSAKLPRSLVSSDSSAYLNFSTVFVVLTWVVVVSRMTSLKSEPFAALETYEVGCLAVLPDPVEDLPADEADNRLRADVVRAVPERWPLPLEW